MSHFTWSSVLQGWLPPGLQSALWSQCTLLTSSVFFHRKTHPPRGLLTNKTRPRWLLQRWQPCQAPPLRSWNRKKRIQKGSLWMKSDRWQSAAWISMFEFKSDEMGKEKVSLPRQDLWNPKLKGRRVLKLAEVPLMVRRSLYLSTVILLILMAIFSI